MSRLMKRFPLITVCMLTVFLAVAGQAWAIGGPVFLSGDDADDGGHCQHSSCGQLYGKALKFVVENSQSSGTGILAIGVNSSRALTGFNSWRSVANGGPGVGVPVTHARSTAQITGANFSNYAAIYIPSDRNTSGGINPTQLSALNTRQADIADFVNQQGGGLMALTEAASGGAKYGWLPFPLTDANITHSSNARYRATADMSIIVPGITPSHLNHGCCYHTVFTGPPGFSGLRVLAYDDHNNNGQFDGPSVDHVLILGGVQITIQGNIGLTPPTALLGTGDTHTVTAAAEDGNPLAPAAGVTVTFTVSAGPNAGASGSCNSAGCTTDAAGNVSFSYVGTNVGTDSIVATFVDANGNTQTSNTVNAEWEQRNLPPVADAGPDQTVEATGATTAVTLDGSGSSDPDGDPLTYAWSGDAIASGVGPVVNLPIGTHTITLTVDDGNGETDTDTVTIVVEDTTAPTVDLDCIDKLWPPNHKMVDASTISVSDAGDADPSVTIVVTSDQPLNDTGDGNTEEDWEVSEDNGEWSVSLRAERAGNIGARTYTITVTATDASGNSTTETCEVVVPHDQSKGKSGK